MIKANDVLKEQNKVMAFVTSYIETAKTTNWKNPAGWTISIKLTTALILFFAIFVSGLFFDSFALNEEIEIAKAKETELKDSYFQKKQQVINFDLLKKQLTQTKAEFGEILKTLPTSSEMSGVLKDINKAGVTRGVSFLLFKPGQEVITGNLAEQTIDIQVVGSYDEIAAFLMDVEMLNRLVVMHSLELGDYKEKEEKLTLKVTASIYRYIDSIKTRRGGR